MATSTTTSFSRRDLQAPIVLVAIGHGVTHWTAATLYVLLPFITHELGLSYAQAGLLITCFHVGSTAANLPGGLLVDLTGRRVATQAVALLIGSAALFALGVVGAYALLCAAALVLGAANMLWHPAAIAYLSGRFAANRGYALSIHGLGANLGDALAPLFTGWLLLSITWRGSMEVNALLGVGTAALIAAVLLRSDAAAVAAAKAMDLRGYGRDLLQALKTRAVWSLCLMAAFRTAMQHGLLIFLPLYLANELKMNPFWMGVALMLLQVGGVVAAPIAGILSDRIGRRPVVLSGMVVTTILVVGLTLVSDPVIFVACISVLGFSMYALRPVIHSWLMDISPPQLAASMTSAMFGTQAALSALIPVIGGIIADAYGLGAVFYLLAASMLVANLLAFAVPRSDRAAASPRP